VGFSATSDVFTTFAGINSGNGPTYFIAATNLDSNTSSALFQLAVHQNETNAAFASIELKGDSGNNTPDTTFTFPGAALFTGASAYTFKGTGSSVITADDNGTGVAVLVATSSAALSNAVGFTANTSLNSDTCPAFFSLQVHSLESGIATYNTTLRGDQGSAADVQMQFPVGGQAQYTGASLYSFDNTIDTTAYSVNGNAGASGTGTVISAITVENGIITAITVV
jgi:hypothetical protein